MSSKAQRKRAKRSRQITLAGGEAVPQRATGRDRRHTNQPPQEDVRKVPKEARERHTGVKGDDALSPALSTDLGKCIVALTKGDERAQLLDVWGAISAARRNERALILGTTGEPQGASIAMVPEPMQTDPSLRVDLRTHEERVASAKAAWRNWEARINALPAPQLKWAIRAAINGFMGEGALWRDKQPTAHGVAAVEALRHMVARA